MIALAVIAAMGQALQAGVIYAAIAGGVLLALAIVAVAALLTPADWKPHRMREAERPLPWERDIDPGTDEEPGRSEGAGK